MAVGAIVIGAGGLLFETPAGAALTAAGLALEHLGLGHFRQRPSSSGVQVMPF